MVTNKPLFIFSFNMHKIQENSLKVPTMKSFDSIVILLFHFLFSINVLKTGQRHPLTLLVIKQNIGCFFLNQSYSSSQLIGRSRRPSARPFRYYQSENQTKTSQHKNYHYPLIISIFKGLKYTPIYSIPSTVNKRVAERYCLLSEISKDQ